MGTSACVYACKRFKADSAAQPKGSAHCKGPQDHLPIVRYACFVPVAGGFVLTDLLLMPARRPGVDTALQRAFSPRAGGNFLPLSDKNVA